MSNQIQVSEVVNNLGNAYRSFITVKESLLTDCLVVEFSSTFDNARDKDAHQIQHKALFHNKEELRRVVEHLSKYI